jgi:hypothetical protein
MKQMFLILALMVVPHLHAQLPAAPGIPSRIPRPTPAAIDPTTGLPIEENKEAEAHFDIDFPGGPVEDLVNRITRDLQGQRPNIVVHPNSQQQEIPAFRLRGVTISQIFATLNSLAEPDYAGGIWKQVPIRDGIVWTLSKYNPRANAYYGSGLMQIPNQPPAQRVCKIFNLTPYLEDFTVEDLTTSIQGAWDLLKSDSEPTIKYHKETKLLIVVGSTADLSVVAEVLQQLNPSLTQKIPQAGTAPTQSTNKPVIQPKPAEAK